jgi:hypothetical protein
MLSDVCPLVRVSVAYALGRNPSLSAVGSLNRFTGQRLEWLRQKRGSLGTG